MKNQIRSELRLAIILSAVCNDYSPKVDTLRQIEILRELANDLEKEWKDHLKDIALVSNDKPIAGTKLNTRKL